MIYAGKSTKSRDFLWCPMMKKNFTPFFRFYTSRVHDWNDIFAGGNNHTFYIHFAFAIIFKKNLHMNVAKVDFYFIVIHTFFIGYQTSKLVITQTRIEYRVGRVLNCLKNQVFSTRSFNFEKTSNYSTRNLE